MIYNKKFFFLEKIVLLLSVAVLGKKISPMAICFVLESKIEHAHERDEEETT